MAHLFNFFGERKSHPEDGEPHVWWSFGPDEANHARRVLRLKIGDSVAMTDGKGVLAEGQIAVLSDKELLVRETSMRCVPRDRRFLAVSIGALKPGDIDEIIPALVELGVDAIHVFLQEGAEKSRLHPRAQERWHNLVISAMKQCKRAWLPSIESHTSLQDAVSAMKAQRLKLLQLHPEGKKTLLSASSEGGRFGLIVGGEKGFSVGEEAHLRAEGIEAVTLGTHILRATTAAVAATAVAVAQRTV